MIEKFEENLTEHSLPMMYLGILMALVSCCWTFLSFESISDLTPIDFLRILHILSLLSTSFIEEEHQPIYFISMTYIASLLMRKEEADFKWTLLGMFLLRMARTLNQVTSYHQVP